MIVATADELSNQQNWESVAAAALSGQQYWKSVAAAALSGRQLIVKISELSKPPPLLYLVEENLDNKKPFCR